MTDLPSTPSRFSKFRLLPVAMLAVVLASAACTGTANPEGWSAGVVVDDILYTGTRDGKLLAINAKDGTPIWEFASLKGEDDRDYAFYGDPIVVDGVVYAAAYDGYLYAIPAAQGAVVAVANWSIKVGDEAERIVGGVGYEDGILVVASSDGSVYAFDVESTAEKWRFPTDSMVWTTPLVEDGVVYFGSMDKHIYAVYLEGGGEKWKTPVGGAVVAPVEKRGDSLFVGAFDGIFYALNASNGSVINQFDDADGWYWARALTTETAVYVPSLDGRVYALSLDLSEVMWRKPDKTDGPIIGSPTVIGGKIFFASDGGTVWTYSLLDGADERRCRIDEKLKTNLAGIVVPDMTRDNIIGRIYLGAWDRTVRALRVNDFGELGNIWVYKTDKPATTQENPVSDVQSC